MSKKITTYLVLLMFLLALAACGGQDVADEQVAATPDTAVTTDNEGDGETAVSPTTAPVENGELPPLPALNAGGGGAAGGGGLGGGLETALSSDSTAAVTEPIPVEGDRWMPYFENRLETAAFNLNASLPTVPSSTTVWQQTTAELTEEQIRDLASRFGFTGTMYTDPWYDQMAQENPTTWLGPRAYYFFDGPRTLNVFGASLNYYDSSAVPTDNGWAPMPSNEAQPIAEAYLRERGLLDFEYQVVPNPYGGSDVAFHRLVNGVLSLYPEISVTVGPNGSVMSVYTQPFSAFTPVGDYPVISAEEAWQLAQGTPDYQRVFHTVYADPGSFEPFVAEDTGEYRYWARTYQNGDEITLYFYPIIYKAVDGSAPIIKANEFTLIASPDDLQAMAEDTQQYIRLTGVVQGDVMNNQSIRVNSFESMGDYQEWQSREGTIRQADGQTYLDTVDGETFVIPNAPADLPEGEHVYVNGSAIEEGDPYGNFIWMGIDKVVEVPNADEPIMIDPVDFPTPVPITQVNIDKAELVYSYSYSAPVEESGPGATWMQLAWRFTGTTDTNENVELLVQAVAPEYLQATPSN